MNLCVIFGGKSSEHAVSCSTAKNIIENLDKFKYTIYMLGITEDGRWLLYDGETEALLDGSWQNKKVKKAYISPDSQDSGIIVHSSCGEQTIKIDAAYLALHGKYGEDGAIQGLLELAGIPYIGPNVLSSALCMDKDISRKFLSLYGIEQVKYISVTKKDIFDVRARVEKEFTYPVFVKPSACGSSIGMRKVISPLELVPAVEYALEFDNVALIEEFIVGREFECGIVGNDTPLTSLVGEVITDNEFYDYEAKYVEGKANMVIPADITDKQTQKIQNIAKKAYTALGLSGLCRIDFFIEDGSERVLLIELNTLPGCTPSSAFPLLWKKTGTPFPKLLDEVIDYALER